MPKKQCEKHNIKNVDVAAGVVVYKYDGLITVLSNVIFLVGMSADSKISSLTFLLYCALFGTLIVYGCHIIRGDNIMIEKGVIIAGGRKINLIGARSIQMRVSSLVIKYDNGYEVIYLGVMTKGSRGLLYKSIMGEIAAQQVDSAEASTNGVGESEPRCSPR